MKYRISKRSLTSGLLFIIFFIAAIYLAYLWLAEGMPLYTNKYNPGSQKSMFPIILPAIICALIAIVAGLDVYLYSKNDEE